jgi:hypothetical protein
VKSTPTRGVKETLKRNAYKQSERPPFKSLRDLKGGSLCQSLKRPPSGGLGSRAKDGAGPQRPSRKAAPLLRGTSLRAPRRPPAIEAGAKRPEVAPGEGQQQSASHQIPQGFDGEP